MSAAASRTPSSSSSAEARHVPHSEGEIHPVMGDPMRFIMTADHTGGSYAICEQEIRPGNGAPPHIHHRESESFYILDGTFAATVDGREVRLGPGDFVHVPRGAVRSFTNTGSKVGRLLILHVPGAASSFYVAMGKLPFPPALEDISAIAKEHGIELAQHGEAT